jgi:hypothetical protein
MLRSVLILLIVLPLCACGAVQRGLQDQTDPRYHPFHSYGNGAG